MIGADGSAPSEQVLARNRRRLRRMHMVSDPDEEGATDAAGSNSSDEDDRGAADIPRPSRVSTPAVDIELTALRPVTRSSARSAAAAHAPQTQSASLGTPQPPPLGGGAPAQAGLTVRGCIWAQPDPFELPTRFQPPLCDSQWVGAVRGACNCGMRPCLVSGWCVDMLPGTKKQTCSEKHQCKQCRCWVFLQAELEAALNPARTRKSDGFCSLDRKAVRVRASTRAMPSRTPHHGSHPPPGGNWCGGQNNLQRKRCYRKVAINVLMYTLRAPLPDCFIARVRSVWPSATGIYMGFMGR